MRGAVILSLFAHALVACATSTYDYIVIGGGAGGLAVASRLSEDPKVNVLVLEAGEEVEDLPVVFVPGLVGVGQSPPTINWSYRTVPQPSMNGRQLVVSAGKALGGSTVINSMIFTRATEKQYDAFSALNNNSASWTWDTILPFFKRSESFTPPNADQIAHGAMFEKSVHGFSSSHDTNVGKVKAGFPNFFFPQSEMFVQAVTKNGSGLQGFQRSPDLTDGNVQRRVGVAPNSLDATNNTRCTSVCAYYTPFTDRPNFEVITGAMVSKIVWDADQKNGLVAKAVEYYVNATGEPQYANLNAAGGGEVVLAAGTIGSPKVMELSGVGNATLLKGLGIEPVLDFPTVGENLADHVHSWANAFTNASLNRDILSRNPDFLAQQMDLWNKNRTGLLSSAPRTLGMPAVSNLLPKQRIADLVNQSKQDLEEYARKFANGNSALQKGIEAQHKIVLGLYQQDAAVPLELNIEPGYSGPTARDQRPVRNFTTISAVFYNPLSRGRTHISSSDYTIPPAVDPAYWSHPLDVAVHVAGFQAARKILRSPPLDQIYQGEFEPGVGASDEEAEAYLRAFAASDQHETGTMAMMPKEFGGVVDTELKVYGTGNVRVADASIIPLPVSAHLSSTVYMIGEKAADFIKKGRQAL